MSAAADLHLSIMIGLGYLLLNLSGVGLIMWWGYCNNQFKDQNRARYLALWCDEEPPQLTLVEENPGDEHDVL
jgi:nitrogen fixation-related uncharacterized protein